MIIPTDSIVTERQSVLDDLNLSMLFLGTAHVEAIPAGELEDADEGALRRLGLRVLARSPLSPAMTAALLCRVLHNRRIPGVEIDRIADGVRLRCAYLLPTGRWRLDIVAPIA
ncbi:MAG: hypothetical protein ABW091_15900 [Microbacterium sp.]